MYSSNMKPVCSQHAENTIEEEEEEDYDLTWS